MASNNKNSKRIIKNTAILYVRMIVVMMISLYTSRIVLQALGVNDFGLYNVVGGVVGLLTFFNTTMAKATQRFLNVEMVKSDKSLSDIFSSSITVHLIIALLFFCLCETLGLWFLDNKVNIPIGREESAAILYHTTILSLCTSIILIPYNAAVIAYEKMSFIAIVSIVDAVLKLGISLYLLIWEKDKLVLYGILLFAINILNFILYFSYTHWKYPTLKFCLSFNKQNFKQIFGYVSWTLLGQFAIVGCNQGNVILVNLFHSVVANAAMSVGSQINHAITNLTSNFQTAFNPQITKSFARGDYTYLSSLVYSTSKISFCILFVVALPVAFNVDWILKLWLGKVPYLSNTFAILFMANGIINALSSPFNFTVLSSDKIKKYQMVVSVIFITDIPIAYCLFSFGFPPPTVLVVKVCVMVVAMFVRIYFASRIVPTINVHSYVSNVLSSLFIVSFISIVVALILDKLTSSIQERLIYTLLVEIVCFISIWILCLTSEERNVIVRFVNSKS